MICDECGAKMERDYSYQGRSERYVCACGNIISVVPADVCPTCGKYYQKPGVDTSNFCSNGFHCCRDCDWKDGRVVEPCPEHRGTS